MAGNGQDVLAQAIAEMRADIAQRFGTIEERLGHIEQPPRRAPPRNDPPRNDPPPRYQNLGSEDETNTSEVDWGEGESHHSWGRRDDHDVETCNEETDSEISYDGEQKREEENNEIKSWCDEGESQFSQEGECYGYEPELEESQYSIDAGGYGDESRGYTQQHNHEDYEEENHEDESWYEKTNFHTSQEDDYHGDEQEPGGFNHKEESYTEQISWCEKSEDNHDKELYGEIDSQTSLVETEPCDASMCEDEGYKPEYISFSGHSEGPEAYLRWEEAMEDWFQSNQVPEAEKTAIAEDTLIKEAIGYWDQLDYVNEGPDFTWEEMKGLMYDEFVDGDTTNSQYYALDPAPRRLLLWPNPKTMPKACCPISKNVLTHHLKGHVIERITPEHHQQHIPSPQAPPRTNAPMHAPLREPQVSQMQGKFSNSLESTDVICYRCHLRGHFAAMCRTKQVVDTTTLGLKPNSLKSSNCLIQSDLELSNSSMMHLSLPKNINTGHDHVLEHKETEVDHKKSEPDSQEHPQHGTQASPYRGKALDSQNRMKANLLSLGADCTVSRSKLLEGGGYDADIKPATSTTHQANPFGSNVYRESSTTSPEKTYASCISQTECEFLCPCPTTTWNKFLAQLEISSKWNQPIIRSHEEVMANTIRTDLKHPDLDLRALGGGFLTDQEELSYELTFSGNLTQEGIAESWNQAKNCSGSKVMIFTNQGILHGPVLEANGFGNLQSHVWRPGESLPQLEDNNSTWRFIHNHWIKWTRSCPHIHQDFLYPTPRAFTLGRIRIWKYFVSRLVQAGAAPWKPSWSFRGFPYNPGRRLQIHH